MKNSIKLLLSFVMIFSFTNIQSQSMEDSTVTDIIETANDIGSSLNISDYVETNKISSWEGLITEYVQKIVDKTGQTISEAVDILVREGTIITKQYIMYNAIVHGLATALGLFLILFLTRKVFRYFILDKQEAEDYNAIIEKSKKPEYQKDSKYIKVLGNYFKTWYHSLLTYVFSSIPLILGLILVANNMFIFIKAAFFQKYFITEMVINYLQTRNG